MFLVGETIHIELVGLDVKVTQVTPTLLKGVSVATGREFNLGLTGHSYAKLLHLVPLGEPQVIHADGDDRSKHMVLPSGDVVMSRRYAKQWQWYVNGVQESGKKVWALLYS